MNFDFTQDLLLQNKRALLRPMRHDDLSLLEAIASGQPDLVQYSPYYIHTPEYLNQFIQASLAERAKGTRYPFVIFDKEKNTYAGSTSIGNVSNKDKRLEIGWTWIGKAFQQTGLNRACKYALLSYIFEELQFERVEFKTDERNTASRTAIEKIGGRYEGALRSHTVLNDGFRRTTVYYSILREEWPQVKANVFQPFAAEARLPAIP